MWTGREAIAASTMRPMARTTQYATISGACPAAVRRRRRRPSGRGPPRPDVGPIAPRYPAHLPLRNMNAMTNMMGAAKAR